MARKKRKWNTVRSVSGMFWRLDAKGRRRYAYDFDHAGKRYYGALGTNKDAAIRELETIRTRARLAAAGLSDNNLPLGTLYDKYSTAAQETLRASTWKQYLGSFKPIWRFFNPKLLVADLTPAAAERYKAARTRSGKSARTVQLELSVLNAMLNWGVDAHLIERNPVAKVRISVTHKEKPIFTPEEYEKLLSHTHPKYGRGTLSTETAPCQCRALWIMFAESGMRLSEVANLEWRHVDFERRVIHVKPTSRYALKNGRSVHSFRHGLGTRLCRAKVHTSVGKTILRHASSRMLDRIYTHISEEDQRAAIDAVQNREKVPNESRMKLEGES